MNTALVGMGSNIRPEYHLLAAAKVLRHTYTDVVFSHVYRSAAVGMQGDDFLNACCLLQGVPEQIILEKYLKTVEDAYLRDRSEGSWKPRTLDLDVLVYNNQVVDDDVYCYAHVFVPTSELIQLELPVAKPNQVRRVSLCL